MSCPDLPGVAPIPALTVLVPSPFASLLVSFSLIAISTSSFLRVHCPPSEVSKLHIPPWVYVWRFPGCVGSLLYPCVERKISVWSLELGRKNIWIVSCRFLHESIKQTNQKQAEKKIPIFPNEDKCLSQNLLTLSYLFLCCTQTWAYCVIGVCPHPDPGLQDKTSSLS